MSTAFKTTASSETNLINELCRKDLIDYKTLGVVAVLAVGNPTLVWLHHSGYISSFFGIILGSLSMNLSFTAWHECSHGNFSIKKSLNTIVGYIASLFALYPGYFAARREHLIHHFYEGDAQLDPVYPRIQCRLTEFPLRLIKTFYVKLDSDIYQKTFPYSAQERLLDRLTLGCLGLLCLLSLAQGFFLSLFFCWILPRGIIFWAHAYYICYFPHAKDQGGFEKYRIRKVHPLLYWLTMGQTAHGIHHKWVSIPWHRYPQALKILRKNPNGEIEVR